MYLGLFLAAAQSANPPVSKIAVEAYGQVKQAPDIVKLRFDVRGEGSTSDAAARLLVGTDRAIAKSLASFDPSLTVEDRGLEIKPLRGPECKVQSRYNDDDETPMTSGDCAIKGYQASKTVAITTKKIADAGTMLGLIARHGGLSAEVEEFDIADNHAARSKAIAAALAEAEIKAKAVAAGSHVRLGPILSVTLDRAQLDEPYVPTFYRPPPPAAERDEPVAIGLNPAPITTSAQVSVVYSIEP
ncbi:MAG TPA: SIMPL domain-containing protein [Sphingomicrobium sp.]